MDYFYITCPFKNFRLSTFPPPPPPPRWSHLCLLFMGFIKSILLLLYAILKQNKIDVLELASESWTSFRQACFLPFKNSLIIHKPIDLSNG